ncbi:MAG: hypothetical protein ACLTDR_11000 [Adlercreutzia equolifaciens]
METNVEEMTEAAQAVKTGARSPGPPATPRTPRATPSPRATSSASLATPSRAVRRFHRRRQCLTLLGKMEAEDADTCTILAGEGYSDEDLEALVAKIEEAYDELEVDAQRGEQPLYLS